MLLYRVVGTDSRTVCITTFRYDRIFYFCRYERFKLEKLTVEENRYMLDTQ